MNLIRLGDKLDKASVESRRPYFKAADNLSKRIFNPEINGDVVEDFYIQSRGREISISNDIPEQQKIFINMGEYERTVTGKIQIPVRKVLCIVGTLGCGKTTTIKYLVRRLKPD